MHNDCLWVLDEVQLMGAGLTTSAQLEAFRRCFPLGKHSRTLWVSATLNRDWLATVDMRPHMTSLTALEISDKDREQAADRLNADKRLSPAGVALTMDAGNKGGLQDYLRDLCELVVSHHDATAQTLVIVNQVGRAQPLFRLLRQLRPGKPDLLIHSRFRAAERSEQALRLREEPGVDRIVVATQAIEAGVDVSSKTLVTELAPWSSLVQRFGRCNRYGEHKGDGAKVLWVNIHEDADLRPYAADSLAAARRKLNGLESVSLRHLPPTDEARPLIAGCAGDVPDSRRDRARPGVQVFWREFKDDPNTPEIQVKPDRQEICPISMGQATDINKRGAWYWDTLGNRKGKGLWAKLERNPRPGMTLLLRAADGGYDEDIGFDAGISRPTTVVAILATLAEVAYGDDRRSRQTKPVALTDHLGHVAAQADALCDAVGETDHRASVVRAARWHDLGKAHAVFDATMHACDLAPAGFLAKSPCNSRHSRPFFRHELASMLAWLAQHEAESDADLIAYLIAAHHGKVRMSLRAMPAEEAGPEGRRFARGVWEGDVLPALTFDGEHSAETRMKLALMEIGEGDQGPSWTERTLRLLDHDGPFRLAWLETLVRLADWRASAEEQR
jgi:CRISPR-associated endonuclease/helicase Cas3